jgi:hypothetical protein
MNVAVRLTGFAVGLAAVFAAGLGLGAVVGGSTSASAGSSKEAEVNGPADSQGGYTLVPEATAFEPGATRDFRFRIVGPDGAVVHDFRVQHEKELHLIVVSVDLAWYAHVHPVRDAEGTWAIPLQVPSPGPYRAFADFAVAGGPALVLAVELDAAGEAHPQPLPPPAPTARVDGYEVTLAGAPAGPGEGQVILTVSRDGQPVTDLEPYLGAYGHLVALRAGDLAYLHVHPDGQPGDGSTRPGPEVRFGAHLPSAGDYRLFFDFQHQGVVRTAAFTLSVPSGGSAPGPTTPPGGGPGGGHGGHGDHG